MKKLIIPLIVSLVFALAGCQEGSQAEKVEFNEAENLSHEGSQAQPCDGTRIITTDADMFSASVKAMSATLNEEEKERFKLAMTIINEYPSNNYFMMVCDRKEIFQTDANWAYYPGLRYHLLSSSQKEIFKKERKKYIASSTEDYIFLIKQHRLLCVKLLLDGASLEEVYSLEQMIRELDMDLNITFISMLKEKLSLRGITEEVILTIPEDGGQISSVGEEGKKRIKLKLFNKSDRRITEIVVWVEGIKEVSMSSKFYSTPIKPGESCIREFEVNSQDESIPSKLEPGQRINVRIIRCEVGLLVIDVESWWRRLADEIESETDSLKFAQDRYKKLFGKSYQPKIRKDIPEWVD